jgi:hypothetical protein
MKQYVFVAGFDFEFHGLDFRKVSDYRVKFYIKQNRAKEDLKFHIFDFRKGEVLEITYTASTRETKEIVKAQYDRITKYSYYSYKTEEGKIEFRFKPGQMGTLSILDIYDAVRKIGENSPSSLFELSFFSHAHFDGPVLVNSYDDRILTPAISRVGGLYVLQGNRNLPSTQRDPDDKDPRQAFDFIAPTMDTISLSNFTNAFNREGHIWIWGCNWGKGVLHYLLSRIRKSSGYRQKGLTDWDFLMLTTLHESQVDLLEKGLKNLQHAREYKGQFNDMFKDRRNIYMPFGFLIAFFCAYVASTYASAIAKAAKIKTYAGAPGVGADFVNKHQEMAVASPNFKPDIVFYNNYLKLQLDPEGKNYVAYNHDWTCPVILF